MKYDLHNELLGIPLVECPANHYRLLGLDLFEADADKIHAAVLRRVAELRKYALHSDPDRVRRVQDLLNEVSRAGTVLESPDGKRAYDDALRKDMGIVADRQPCPNCGANLAADAAICPFCGLLVRTGQFLGSTVQAEETHAIHEAPPAEESRSAATEVPPGEPPSQDLVAAGTVSRVPRAQEPSAKRIVARRRAIKVGVALVLGVIVLFMVGLVWRGKPATRQMSVSEVADNPPELEDKSDAVRAFFPMTPKEAKQVQAAAAEALGAPLYREIDLAHGVKLKMVFIPPGEFMMGSEGGPYDQKPVHWLSIAKAFYMGATEVTQAQWEAVMGGNPSRFKGRHKPVEQVSWNDCREFLAKLCAKEGAPEGTYRLPTEAEWEYACRAGSTTKFYFGDDASELGDYAWYGENSGRQSHPVGVKTPNAWGLHDMYGNVRECCQSLYKLYPYRADDSREDLSVSGLRVLRGGSWFDSGRYCRSANRIYNNPSYRNLSLGFRVVVVPSLQESPAAEAPETPKAEASSEKPPEPVVEKPTPAAPSVVAAQPPDVTALEPKTEAKPELLAQPDRIKKALRKEMKLTFFGEPLKEAVEQVAAEAGVKVEFEEDVTEAVKKKVSTVVSGSAADCLGKLLHSQLLDYDVTDEGVVIGERSLEDIQQAARDRAAERESLDTFGTESERAAPGRRLTWKPQRRRVTVATPDGEKKRSITYYVNSIGMQFVRVPAGEFEMGSPNLESGRDYNEGPVHPVRIVKDFYLGATEVTQAQWESVMGNNPSHFKGRDNPVDQVSWNDCQEFLTRLCGMEEVPEGTYRLPTEAEWEYACRAGSKTKFHFGDDASRLGEYAWSRENSNKQTHPVGEKTPNAWGLYDMHGNVWEWCQSLYKRYPYRADDGREDLSAGGGRVLRGGSWFNAARYCRSANRDHDLPTYRYDYYFGFRVVVFRSPQE